MSNFSLSNYLGLSRDINKQKGKEADETDEGVVSDILPELRLDMDDDDIVALTDKWEADWKNSNKRAEWEKQMKDNEEYWLGKQFNQPKADSTRPPIDNLIFESLETYLPQVTRRNPEALVQIHSKDKSDEPNEQHEKYVTKTKNRLKDIADENKLRLKLKKVARHWAVYLLGVVKYGWDIDNDIPSLRVIRPKRIILDPNATIDEDGYNGDRIGEYRKMQASDMLRIIGDDASKEVKDKINDLTKGDNATEIQFIEWWTQEYICWKLDKTILYKRKNPHWNYDTEENEIVVDEYGEESESINNKIGNNHFPVPKMPFSFLSVFNLGDRPMDSTSLIGQNLANQDLINKRNRQIDKNTDNLNNGAVVSLSRSGLSESQAKNVALAVQNGGTVIIPDGSPRDAIDFPSKPALPSDVYNQLIDTRSRLREIFGTSGSSPAGVRDEKTVRGKIQIRGLDTDRIGGGVSEYLEQLSDDIYNWFVQLLYVYDTDFQFVEGAEPPKLNISVKEGSLLPKDSVSIANQALELARMNRISNVDLYKRLEYPNPEDLAANVWLEQNAPHVLYKDNPMIKEALQMQQQEQQQRQEDAIGEEEIKAMLEVEKERAKQGAQARGNIAEDVLPDEIPTSEIL